VQKAVVVQWGMAKSKQVLPSHFQLTSRGMEACDTWKHLHTTQEIKYKNLVTLKRYQSCMKRNILVPSL